MDNSKRDMDLDWKNRVLCSDESCIGVIGSDGRCKECGLAYQGDLPPTFKGDAEVEVQERPGSDEEPVAEEAGPVEEAIDTDEIRGEGPDDDWARRKLCRDESCIGVIGPDGRCKECGKPY